MLGEIPQYLKTRVEILQAQELPGSTLGFQNK